MKERKEIEKSPIGKVCTFLTGVGGAPIGKTGSANEGSNNRYSFRLLCYVRGGKKKYEEFARRLMGVKAEGPAALFLWDFNTQKNDVWPTAGRAFGGKGLKIREGSGRSFLLEPDAHERKGTSNRGSQCAGGGTGGQINMLSSFVETKNEKK